MKVIKIDTILTKQELADYLKVTERSIDKLRDKGLPCLKVGKSVRFEEEKVMEWLDVYKKQNEEVEQDGVLFKIKETEHFGKIAEVTGLDKSLWFQAVIEIRKMVGEYHVTSIGKYAFSKATSLSKIIIPNSVTRIREGAFLLCTNLKQISIPGSVTSIADNAFPPLIMGIILSGSKGSYIEQYANENHYEFLLTGHNTD